MRDAFASRNRQNLMGFDYPMIETQCLYRAKEVKISPARQVIRPLSYPINFPLAPTGFYKHHHHGLIRLPLVHLRPSNSCASPVATCTTLVVTGIRQKNFPHNAELSHELIAGAAACDEVPVCNFVCINTMCIHCPCNAASGACISRLVGTKRYSLQVMSTNLL